MRKPWFRIARSAQARPGHEGLGAIFPGDTSLLLRQHRVLDVMAIALIALMAMQAGVGQTPETNHRGVPVLIELFTSEGCSSCPPADEWLEKMDSSQPIPGAEAIVLSEHVDYWNHDGWKDPYSSSELTERQSTYAREFGLNSPYTPQAIVDGGSELHLDDAQQIQKILQKSATAEMIPIDVGRVSVDGDSSLQLRAHINIDGQSAKHGGDVFAVIALDHAESQVLRGENGGKRLSHVAVVQQMMKVGKLKAGSSLPLDFQTKLRSGTDRRNLRLIILLQESGQGKIVGAAMRKPES